MARRARRDRPPGKTARERAAGGGGRRARRLGTEADMNMTYCVYSICLAGAGLGMWLFTPARRRLEIVNRGKKGASRMKRLLARKVDGVLDRFRKSQKEREIYEAISFLRNVTAVGMSERMSADLAIQKLAENRGLLQPVYTKALGLLRMNKKSEAEACFAAAVGGGIGRDFIRAVLQWDEIDPKELVASLTSYQKSMKEVRITARKKKDELISELVYVPVVVNILVVFMNFIFVAYFLEQKDMLKGLFF
jgi:hypothetical protein